MTTLDVTDMLNELFLFRKRAGRFYVYVLCRPDGRPFYVGKGCGDRIFTHEREARRGCECRKCRTIRKIWSTGGEVARHMVFSADDELTVYQVEAHLIQRFRPLLANIADYDASIWRLVKARPQRISRREAERRRIESACNAINNLDRQLRRAIVMRESSRQAELEARIEAHHLVLRPPLQLRLEGF